jgi:hypothetical protein
VPNARPYFGVARLLVGGLAARLDLGYEQMDDLQLAVETVLTRCHPTDDHVTLEAAIDDGALALSIGPLSQAVGTSETPDGSVIPFATLLDRLVERSAMVERGDEVWLRLEQRIPSRPR